MVACKPALTDARAQAARAEPPKLAVTWAALTTAAALAPPAEGDTAAQVDTARKLFVAIGDLDVAPIVAEANRVEADAKLDADAKAEAQRKPTLRLPIPDGVVPRQVGIAAGLSLAGMAFALSVTSLLSAVSRRRRLLAAIRAVLTQASVNVEGGRDPVARTAAASQAAVLLQLASRPNGGEPGVVVGAGLGAAIAAKVAPADGDLFLAATMAGLIVGLGAQWAFRTATTARKFRERALALADVEKPVVSIPLVLGGVKPGLEGRFIGFLSGLSAPEAAQAVERLAMQAEEAILAGGPPPGVASPSTAP